MARVTAGWALVGKRPGSSDDYGVLNFSREPYDRASYGKILHRYALGTPPAHTAGEGALPWVAVSWVGEQPDRYLGISVETWSEHRDGAGRQVAFTKYVCVPYRQVQAEPVSYTALFREVQRLDLPMDGGPTGGVELTLPQYDPVAPARDIERFGTERVMRAAAMLLDGNVDVVQAGDATLWDRLAFLDAVAALLPYGYRAGFTGATWATGPAPNIRLLFTRRARGGNRELSWHGPDEPVRLSPTATDYLRHLHKLLNHRFPDLAGLVSYLASDGTPCEFSDPGHALRSLADVEWPSEVAAAVRAGRANLHDVRRLVRGQRIHELHPADRPRVFDHLVRAADPDDLELIERRWDDLAPPGGPGDPLAALVEAAAVLLWREQPDGRISRYLEVARRRRFAGEFLAELVRWGADPDLQGPEYRAARTMVADLIRDAVDPFRPEEIFSPLVVNVVEDRGVAAALLIGETAGERRVAAWVAWLENVRGDLMDPFRTVLDGRQVTVETIGGMAQTERTMVAALVWVAARLERLRCVLPALVDWLGRHGEPSRAACEFAAATLNRAEPPDPWAQGASDAVLLMLGSSARFLADTVGHADFRGYEDGFLEAWRHRPTPGMEQQLVVGLTHALRMRPWAGAGTAGADNVLNLARHLVGGVDRDWDPLATVLATEPPDELLAHRPAYRPLRALLVPDEAAHPAARGGAPSAFGGAEHAAPRGHGAVQFTPPPSAGDPMAEHGPAPGPAIAPLYGQGNGTAPPSTEGAFGRIRADSGMDDVAAAYLASVLVGGSAPDALRHLADLGRPLTTREILELARRVEYEVGGRYDAAQAASRVEQLVRAVLDGAPGPAAAAEFRDALADALSAQISRRALLLETAALGDEAWQPTEPVRVRLDEAKDRIDHVAKRGRGKRLPGLGRGKRRSGDG
ncbi:hypothetical protein [Actinomadura rifamycini]|uniref:hypothetical protein n=1 Tax=Actinomadura rifamycini TaxID=31962 RepID=UPI0003FE8E1D|nr:hypothetical protein [Actinomadura rifamycini]